MLVQRHRRVAAVSAWPEPDTRCDRRRLMRRNEGATEESGADQPEEGGAVPQQQFGIGIRHINFVHRFDSTSRHQLFRFVQDDGTACGYCHAMSQTLGRGFRATEATARGIAAVGGELLAGAADTDGRFTLIHSTAPPGDSTPLHRHEEVDESFYVLRGSYTVTCGADTFEVSAGQFVHLPHAVPHKYVAGPDGGEKLILAHPGGLEQFFDEWDAGTDDVRALGRRHGIEFLE